MPVPSLRRRPLAASALAALLALAPAACDLDAGGPEGPRLQAGWLDPMETAPAAGTPPTIGVQGGAGLVQVTGEFVRTCTSGTLRITHALDASALTFRASFTPAQSCTSEPPTRQLLRYFAYLFNTPPGTYDVRVVHENDDLTGAAGTVHEQTVTVF